METQFKKGDKVRIVNPKCTYDAYGAWFQRNKVSHWASLKQAPINKIGTIIKIAPHSPSSDDPVAAVEIKGKVYGMSFDGIEQASVKRQEVSTEMVTALTLTFGELAHAVGRIDDAFRDLEASGLKREAIVVLLADSTKLYKKDINTVLDGLAKLKETYVK